MIPLMYENPKIDRDKAMQCIETVSKKMSVSKDDVCSVIPKFKDIFLRGPIRILEMYSKKYKKRIYLMGETHILEGECPTDTKSFPATDFILDLITSTSKFVDVFLEESFISERISNHNMSSYKTSNIKKSSELLKDCLTIQKNCEYKNLRAHYADVRHVTKYGILRGIKWDIGAFFNEWGLFIPSIEPSQLTKLKNDIREMLTKFMAILKTNWWLDLDAAKIEKQVKMVKYPEVVSLMRKHISEQSALISTAMKDMIPQTKKFLKLLDKDVKTARLRYEYYLWMGYFDSTILDTTLYMMDVYLFSRMFRIFKDLPGKYSKEPQNIVVYTGDSHTKNYEKLLVELGFIYVHAHLGSPDAGCINISSFYPLWSQIPKESSKYYVTIGSHTTLFPENIDEGDFFSAEPSAHSSDDE